MLDRVRRTTQGVLLAVLTTLVFPLVRAARDTGIPSGGDKVSSTIADGFMLAFGQPVVYWDDIFMVIVLFIITALVAVQAIHRSKVFDDQPAIEWAVGILMSYLGFRFMPPDFLAAYIVAILAVTMIFAVYWMYKTIRGVATEAGLLQHIATMGLGVAVIFLAWRIKDALEFVKSRSLEVSPTLMTAASLEQLLGTLAGIIIIILGAINLVREVKFKKRDPRMKGLANEIKTAHDLYKTEAEDLKISKNMIKQITGVYTLVINLANGKGKDSDKTAARNIMAKIELELKRIRADYIRKREDIERIRKDEALEGKKKLGISFPQRRLAQLDAIKRKYDREIAQLQNAEGGPDTALINLAVAANTAITADKWKIAETELFAMLRQLKAEIPKLTESEKAAKAEETIDKQEETTEVEEDVTEEKEIVQEQRLVADENIILRDFRELYNLFLKENSEVQAMMKAGSHMDGLYNNILKDEGVTKKMLRDLGTDITILEKEPKYKDKDQLLKRMIKVSQIVAREAKDSYEILRTKVGKDARDNHKKRIDANTLKIGQTALDTVYRIQVLASDIVKHATKAESEVRKLEKEGVTNEDQTKSGSTTSGTASINPSK